MIKLAKINRVLVFILLSVIILYWGAPFLIPFIFGILIAFLMVPLCNFLERIRIPRIIASMLSTLVVFVIIGGTLFLLIIQINSFVSNMPSITLPILFSFVYFDSLQKILFFSTLVVFIQLIESYVLEPLIIGKEVKLNAMVVIIAIVLGGLMWGLAGMILFVPIFAIVKIISLNQSGLKPIGFLLGHGDMDKFEQ